jgi:AcrR family transcriptional regulator
VFWGKGYEGTSVADLTEAMGINPPSLYAAFGNKEALFKKALDRYEAVRDQIMEEAFAAPTAREAMTRLLEWHGRALKQQAQPERLPHGAGSVVRRRGMRSYQTGSLLAPRRHPRAAEAG